MDKFVAIPSCDLCLIEGACFQFGRRNMFDFFFAILKSFGDLDSSFESGTGLGLPLLALP
jgi:hypothetical protein